MDESSSDPVSMLKGSTSVRKAIPKPRHSNPFYVPRKEQDEPSKEESSSDPTLLKSPARATPSKIILRGITPRTPRSNATEGRMWVTLGGVGPTEEGEDETIRPDTGDVADAQQVHGMLQDDMTLDEDYTEQDFQEPEVVGEEPEMLPEQTDMEAPKEFDEDEEMQMSDGEFQPRTSDDEIAFHLKSQEEQEEIEAEMQELLMRIPDLKNDYELVDRLGTGTFSSVFKAIDRNYENWDNRLWEGAPRDEISDPSSPTALTRKPVYVAIKRIIVTSSPKRILNELLIMESCRGCRHVAQIITAYRVEDQIVAVMPYQRSSDIKDLMKTLGIYAVRQYFRCMFRALRDIHARGIIHRDLKPANFLYDPIENTGTMVDFGLAEEFSWEEERESGCRHTGPIPGAPHGIVKDGVKWTNLQRKSLKISRDRSELPAENVGWPTDDTRPVLKANRAGTRGFRAPEVLFKCLFQTPAVDIWSAGTILLFFLTGKSPIFTASTDMHALLEQALILGKATMEECASLHCRTFATNIPEIQDRTSWTEFVKRLNPPLFPLEGTIPSHPRTEEEIEDARATRLITEACDLLERCLEPNSVHRITARDALYHPFLAPDLDESAAAQEAGCELDDDELFPHPPGCGLCELHHRQTKNGDWMVFVGVNEVGEEEWELIEAGQGQAIGRKACEFHEDFNYS